jgi:hypothetical protein
LNLLRGDCRRALGGKEYWSQHIRALGVIEDDGILRVRRTPKQQKRKDREDALKEAARSSSANNVVVNDVIGIPTTQKEPEVTVNEVEDHGQEIPISEETSHDELQEREPKKQKIMNDDDVDNGNDDDTALEISEVMKSADNMRTEDCVGDVVKEEKVEDAEEEVVLGEEDDDHDGEEEKEGGVVDDANDGVDDPSSQWKPLSFADTNQECNEDEEEKIEKASESEDFHNAEEPVEEDLGGVGNFDDGGAIVVGEVEDDNNVE